MSKTLEEWIEIYERKTKDKFKRHENFNFYWLPEKGFCEIAASDNLIILRCVCGDGCYWKKFAEDIAEKMNLKAIGTWCVRKEFRAYIRLFGFKITKTDEQNGMKRFYGVDGQGRHGMMTECIFTDSGKHGFYVTYNLKGGEKIGI